VSIVGSQIQELFAKAVQVSGAVGAQLSIIRDGEQIDFVQGLANAELGIPMTVDTLIQCGSVTKVLNATMILSLVEEGRLDLDVPVQRYLPELPLEAPITLRQLLSMSAGIDNGDYRDFGAGEDAVAQRLASLRTLPQHFAPGAGFGYSNAGTDITGRVAEKVTGKLWDELLKERVLQPAGLANAATLDRDRMFHRVSVGHAVDPRNGRVQVIRPWGLSRGMGPAGGTLTICAHDLARFANVFLNSGRADSGRQVLSDESVKTMMTAHIDVPVHCQAISWCVGPCIQEWKGVRIWGHRGGNISGVSFLYWIPEKNVAMAWVMNTPAVLPRFEKVIVEELMQAAFGFSKPPIVAPSSPVRIDPARYVGAYESLGGRCVVEAVGQKLVMKKVWKDFVDESRELSETVALIPLGDDRFLVDRGAEANALALPEDIAFFGADGAGGASNLVVFVFPYSRISGGIYDVR
jgi:CubicO group peptidase (beta-lactamase class C family)